MKKTTVILSVIIILSFVVMGAGCNNQTADTSQTEKNEESDSANSSGDLVTALEAWTKVKPEADKWSDSYQIASISDVSDADTQRIDGLGYGWEFFLEECTGNLSHGTCLQGKTRKYYYYTSGSKAGVQSNEEQSITAGRSTFTAGEFMMDSDEAQDKARQAQGKTREEGEEFVMNAYGNGDFSYWEVRKQCYFRNKENCDEDYYTVYVNMETGETYDKKPTNLD